jgi:hypothetical protein
MRQNARLERHPNQAIAAFLTAPGDEIGRKNACCVEHGARNRPVHEGFVLQPLAARVAVLQTSTQLDWAARRIEQRDKQWLRSKI